jgi:hypothetical protein
MGMAAASARSPLEHLTQTAITAGVILVVAMVAWLLASWLWRRVARARMFRTGVLPDAELERYRTYLVEVVGETSRTQGTQVRLRGAWQALNQSRGARLTAAQRYVVLDDLLERGVFKRAYSADSVVRFFQRLRWVELQRPVSVVALSDLDWQRLASGGEASMVANGDIIILRDSPGAGIMSRSPHGRQYLSADLEPQAVIEIVRALRKDAAELREGNPLREQAESYAEHLETELRGGHQARIKEILQDVLSFASNAASLWSSTLSIFSK